ncbi:hypothetical protein V3C99_000937 [Haemonchus contortus]
MQNELLDPPLSQGVMQHVTLPPQPMSGPLSQPPTSSIAESEQTDPNRARKVAEVFLTAGHAFQKLGDLAMQLHMGPSSVPNEERWSENNVDHLREALTRFAHELDQISNNVQARTTKMISTDIRRRHMAPQRPVASAISTLKRQPTRLGPVIVPKRLNVTRSATRPQYVPGRLATAPPAISQVIVPTTKTYPMTRTTSSTFAGQRQYLMPLTQPEPDTHSPYPKFRDGFTSRPTHFGASDNGRCSTAIGSTDMIPVRTFFCRGEKLLGT